MDTSLMNYLQAIGVDPSVLQGFGAMGTMNGVTMNPQQQPQQQPVPNMTAPPTAMPAPQSQAGLVNYALPWWLGPRQQQQASPQQQKQPATKKPTPDVAGGGLGTTPLPDTSGMPGGVGNLQGLF